MDTLPPKTKLTDKYERFAEEYIIDLNATQAAIRAGYSEKTARSQGQRLLTIPAIQDRIQELKIERAKRTAVTADMVVDQLAKIAFADIKDFLDFGQREVPVMGVKGQLHEVKKKFDIVSGSFKTEKIPITKTVNYVDFKNSDVVDGCLISKVKQGKDGSSLELLDRMKAFEMLGRHLGMFKDNLNLTTDKKLEDFMK